MDVMFRELARLGEVGMVMKDDDVEGRSPVPWLNLFTPPGEARVRKPHLVEQMLLAAEQPL